MPKQLPLQIVFFHHQIEKCTEIYQDMYLIAPLKTHTTGLGGSPLKYTHASLSQDLLVKIKAPKHHLNSGNLNDVATC